MFNILLNLQLTRILSFPSQSKTRISISFVCLLIAATSVIAAFNEPRRGVYFEPGYVNLDLTEAKQAFQIEITLCNKSDKNIKVLHAITSCGCALVKDIEGTTVLSGKSLSLPMNWNVSDEKDSARVDLIVVYCLHGSPSTEENTVVFRCYASSSHLN